MNRFLLVSALLGISAVIIEGRFLKRESEPFFEPQPVLDQTCRKSDVEKCLGDLEKYGAIFMSEHIAQTSLSNRTILDGISADLNKAVDCLDVTLERPSCAGLSDSDWDVLRLLADFMDSSERRDIIQAAVQTHCLTNNTAADTAGYGLVMCYLSFAQHAQSQQDTCAALEAWETCTVTSATTHCGADAGALVQSIWDFVGTPEVRDTILAITGMDELSAFFNSCQPQAQVVQSVAKRAMAILRK